MSPQRRHVTALISPNAVSRAHGEPVGAIYGLTVDGLGEVSIFVPEEYLEEARTVLAAGEHGDLELGDREAAEDTEPSDF